jgi:hypothetical protein
MMPDFKNMKINAAQRQNMNQKEIKKRESAGMRPGSE